jgi:hypothetical protein
MSSNNILDNVSVAAICTCSNYSCQNFDKSLDIVSFAASEREDVYSQFESGDIAVSEKTCNICQSELQLGKPCMMLMQRTVDGETYDMQLRFTADDLMRLAYLHKGATEDLVRGKKIFVASDEAFKFDTLFEVYPSDASVTSVDGIVSYPSESPLENINKVIVATKKGISLSVDVRKADGSLITVLTPQLTFTDLDALSSVAKIVNKENLDDLVVEMIEQENAD